MPDYLHGVETLDVAYGPRQIRAVKSATIGIVGTAPVYLAPEANRAANVPRLITSPTDVAAYAGPEVAGFTLPKALGRIFDQGSGIVAMVNVFDPAVHKRDMASKTVTFAAGRVAFEVWGAGEDIGAPALVITVALDGYTEGTDFERSANGDIVALEGGAIDPAGTAEMTAVIADPSLVSAAEIIGTVDADGVRTGMQALLTVQALFNFSPYTNIAPGFSTLPEVKAALEVIAPRLNGIGVVDAPLGATPQEVIAARGTAGSFDLRSGSDRIVYTYPHLEAFDTALGAGALEPYSAAFAGVMARVDTEEGFWVSPSNHQILGITGMERPITAGLSDAASEANLLNEAGIVTVYTGYGTGYRVWGNRNASWPASTDSYTFIPVRKTADMVGESIEQSSLQFVDMGINTSFIDQVKESVNEYIRTLVGRGALVGGECWYNPDKNSTTELAAGHIVFSYDLTYVYPAERMTFERAVNLERLAALGA